MITQSLPEITSYRVALQVPIFKLSLQSCESFVEQWVQWVSGVYGRAVLRHIWAVMKKLTFAEKLGTTQHLSPLLHKAEQLGLSSPALLEALAVARGCWHYRNPAVLPAPAVSERDFSNEELAAALLSPCLPYSAHTIRL